MATPAWAKSAANELSEVRTLSARLKDELLEQCCQLQHDASSVDLTWLATLVAHARALERRTLLLEQVLSYDFESRIGASRPA